MNIGILAERYRAVYARHWKSLNRYVGETGHRLSRWIASMLRSVLVTPPCVEIVVMSLEHSSNLPGGFQVRHRMLGIYQGSAIELAFWYPSSGMPEYGLCRFATKEKAESYRTYLCSPTCPEPLDEKDLTIEPYDLAAHEELTNNHPLHSAWETPT